MWPFKKREQFKVQSYKIDIKRYKPFTVDENLSGFAMLIPQGPVKDPKKQDPRWKKVLCAIFGHRYKVYMVTTMDDEMPYRCTRCKKFRPRKHK